MTEAPSESPDPAVPVWEINIEPIAGRARLAVIGLAVAVAAQAVTVILDVVQAVDLTRYIDHPGPATAGKVSNRDTLHLLGIVLTLSSLAVGAIVFIRWLHLAYRNLDQDDREHTTRWAIWAWFVPFMNLVRPKRILDEVRAVTGGASDELVSLWWGAWILGNVATGVTTRLSTNTLEEFRRSDLADIAGTLITLVAGVLAIQVVRGISTAYEQARATRDRFEYA